MAELRTDGLSLSFGGVNALTDVSIHARSGEVLGVIGPNGSGKSTLINVLTGYYPPDQGSVRINGQDITARSPQHIRRRGIARTFQNLRIVGDLSVFDNAYAGLFLEYVDGRSLTRAWTAEVLGLPAARRRTARLHAVVTQALELVNLAHLSALRADLLSYGDQKRLEIARALVGRPQFIILDEPTAGMSGDDAETLLRDLVEIASSAQNPTSVLLIEHRLELILELSHRVVVMDSGRVIADAEPEQVAEDPEVRRIYVGGE